MGAIDLSRHATNAAKHYDGSRLAQGQVLSDDDFNDTARLAHEDMRRTRVDVIGPAGTPDDGFKITLPTVVGGRLSFTIGPGSFYLGGLRLTQEATELFHLQRDWLQQVDADRPAPPGAGVTRYDLAYLEVWQQPVTGVEDDELTEPAFGGAPPAPRVRTMRRVRVEADVGSDDCKAAWTTVQARWAALGALAPDAELKPNATLQVTYGDAGPPGDLCSPPVNGGFLGAENQSIRVQTLPGNTFVWGYDNASKIYRVKLATLGVERREVEFINLPKDARSRPLSGQIVEILPWSAALANRVRADGTLDDPEKIAEVSGHLSTVDASFNPTTHKITLKVGEGVPGTALTGFGTAWKQRTDNADILGAGPEYVFLRVWDQGDGAGVKATAFAPSVAVPLPGTGLSVTFRGTHFPPDLFWIIAARPETADQVNPWQFDVDAGRAPQGVRRYRTPLGVIKWTGPAPTLVDDCRPPFLPLTRIGGCCRVTVGDNSTSFGHFTSINAAIAALPPAGGEVCVLAGHYLENVNLKGKSNITIHGCGNATVVEGALAPGGGGVGPTFDVSGAINIRITEMKIIAQGTQPGVYAGPNGVLGLHLADLSVIAGPRCGIEILEGRYITILRCLVILRNEPGPWPGVFSGADDVHIECCHIVANPIIPGIDAKATHARGGLQLGGGSHRVRVIDNLIERGIGNGITLGSLRFEGGNDGGVIFWIIDPNDPCDPCKPGDVVIIIIPGEEGRYRSAGDLYDILIERNRIFEMGLNGIGVMGFFDITKVPIVIGVHDLRILGNVIRGCLTRQLAQLAANMQWFAGYGAISLAEVHRLLVRDNDLVENGPRHIDPVCGVFVLIGSAIEISRNRIEENGRRTEEPAAAAMPGYRSGIHIGLAMPQFVDVPPPPELRRLADAAGFPIDRIRRIQGGNSLSVRENTVTQPVGRSLTAVALGHMAVSDNTLTSRGLPSRDFGYVAVPGVLLLGFGASNELELALYFKLLAEASKYFQGDATAFAPEWLKKMCETLDQPQEIEIYSGHLLPSSKVMFVDNRVALDMMGDPTGLVGAPIFAVSTDDLAFGSNQCEADLPTQIGLCQAVLGGMSVRVYDNRFSETRKHVFYSAIIGGLMNTTTNNQSTHCLLPFGPVPTTLVNTGNRALIEMFCGPICNRD